MREKHGTLNIYDIKIMYYIIICNAHPASENITWFVCIVVHYKVLCLKTLLLICIPFCFSLQVSAESDRDYRCWNSEHDTVDEPSTLIWEKVSGWQMNPWEGEGEEEKKVVGGSKRARESSKDKVPQVLKNTLHASAIIPHVCLLSRSRPVSRWAQGY